MKNDIGSLRFEDSEYRVWIPDIQSLAYFKQKATADFWDEHWQIEDLQSYIRSRKSDGNLYRR